MVRASGKFPILPFWSIHILNYRVTVGKVYWCIISGIIKLAVLVVAFLLAVFVAFQLLEINMDFGALTCEYNLYYKGPRFLSIALLTLLMLPSFSCPFSLPSLKSAYLWVFQPDPCHKTKKVSVFLNVLSIIASFLLSTPALTVFYSVFFLWSNKADQI